jgi:oligosaccharyltransferase complex subunit delta (ribophorin II)
LLLSDEILKVNLVLGSFSSSNPLISPVFNIQIYHVPNTPLPTFERPLRYGPRDEIHHIFRVGETSPPMLLTVVFVTAILSTFPALIFAWCWMGGNLDHLPKALQTAPLPHGLFVSSIIAIEGSFFLYYIKWNLFQLLPVFMGLSIVAFLSGVKALSEVQGRRFAGER